MTPVTARVIEAPARRRRASTPTPSSALVRAARRRGPRRRRRRHVASRPCPPTRSRRVDLTARAAGVVAGAPVAALVVRQVVAEARRRPDAPVDVEVVHADGARVAARRRRRHRDRPDARAAHRRAHRAEPALPPVRRRDADPPLGRRGRGHRRRDPRHPQDHARPARAREVRGALRRRRQPPHVAVRRRAGQGQPRRRGRRRRARRSRWCARRSPASPVEVEVDDVAGALEAVEAGADLVLLDNFDVAAAARGGRGRRRPRAARGQRRAHPRQRARRRRDRRRLPRRRRAHPLRRPCSTSASTCARSPTTAKES